MYYIIQHKGISMKHRILYLALFIQCSTVLPIMVGGWVPYWKPKEGTATAIKHLAILDQVSPFAFEVQADGTLKDTFNKYKKEWQNLAVQCMEKQKLLIPTISWHSAQQIHTILPDTKKRAQHIQSIMDLVRDNALAGININYENMQSHDRKPYMAFIEELSQRLHAEHRLLHITLEARTSDTTVTFQEEIQINASYCPEIESYKECLARCADQVIVMAYDEWDKPYNRRTTHRNKRYYVAHTSNQWVEQVIQYALSFIPSYKLVIGAPTYGIEFTITHTSPTSITCKKKRSVLHKTTQELIYQKKLSPKRTPGGEMSLTYRDESKTHYVIYPDAHTIKDKINLATQYDLKGLYLFAIYGNEDENMWKLFAA